MNSKVIFVMFGLAALAAADSRESYEYYPRRGSSEESYESSEGRYSFNYAVDHDPSSNEFGHQETRDSEETRGSYYVELPDGRLQIVKYFVDGDSGYIADVNYEGSASFESGSAESYERPRYYYDSNESK